MNQLGKRRCFFRGKENCHRKNMIGDADYMKQNTNV